MTQPMELLRRLATAAVASGVCFAVYAKPAGPEADIVGPADFGGPPPGIMPGGPGPFGGPGGPGPGMREEVKVLKKFDKDGTGWLNTQERQVARKFLEQENAAGRRRGPGPFGGPGGPRGPGERFGGPRGFGGFGRNESAPQPGTKISPADVKSCGDAPLYAANVLRTLFLQFESPDWEKELEAFRGTDVEVAATLTVDGKTYRDVGVRFRGNTSYMMVSTGRKRPLNISMDMAHAEQHLMGFRTLNLLNSHEDPSLLHTVLAMQMARDYLAAPRANFVRLVINGENWGIYPNVEQFNKDFLRDNFGTTKGVRWKVPGSPGGRGGLEYLGEDVAQYRRIYEIASRDEQKAWLTLMNLCKVLNETPTRDLEAHLAPILDIDGALRFLAWDNVLAGGDGFWTRASDYTMYEDSRARFRIIPYDVNETFSAGGGPGGPGGGPGGFGPGMFLVPQFLDLGDKDGDGKLSVTEFNALADAWFDRMDAQKSGATAQERWVEGVNELLPPPRGAEQVAASRGGPAGPARFGPGMFLGPALFSAADANKDKSVTRSEVKELFARWFAQWNTGKADALDEGAIRTGLNSSLPRPQFGGPGGGGPGGPGAPAGPRPGQGSGAAGFAGGLRGPGGTGGPGFGAGPGRGGTSLDPLVGTTDSTKPLISKLLAVPRFRVRYLGYVRHMAENWLDWNKLGPIARQYHTLISNEVKADTKKVDSFEEFQSALGEVNATSPSPGRASTLKAFVEQRGTFLRNHPDVKAARAVSPGEHSLK